MFWFASTKLLRNPENLFLSAASVKVKKKKLKIICSFVQLVLKYRKKFKNMCVLCNYCWSTDKKRIKNVFFCATNVEVQIKKEEKV
jgi:hypothetical protein